MPVRAAKANGMSFLPKRAGIEITNEKNETAITAYSGTLLRLTRPNSPQPGIARSRENAYHVREALVRPAVTQKIWPITAIRITSLAAHESRALVKIAWTAPAASLTALTSLAANRKARMTNQPINVEKKTERHTPWAAVIAALRVSSAVCADAS